MATKKKTTKRAAKKTTKKPLVNRIAIVLDRSGSMGVIRKETVDAFNQQVDTIAKDSKGTETTVSLFTFATVADEPAIFNQPASSLKKLTEAEYVPDGYTAMYDSVGLAIEKLTALPVDKKKDTAYLVVVISDGEENNSKKYTAEIISEKVKELQATKRWTFTYLGANQDLAKVSKHLGIPLGNTMAFVASVAGVTRMSANNAIATSKYISGRGAGMSQTCDFYSGVKADGADDTNLTGKGKKKVNLSSSTSTGRSK